MEKREILAMYAYEFHGEWSKIAMALKTGHIPKKYNIVEKYITIYDENYPQSLRSLRYPPWILFYEGDISLLNLDSITVVGSRNASEYGLKMTNTIVSELAPYYCITSGLALGIDAIAHRTAIKTGNRTIAVIGSGLKTEYPSANRDLYHCIKCKQLILSEYPYETPVCKYHFPWRNRILAALSKIIFVTQASCKSGTMITVNEAIHLGKEIYCVPFPYGIDDGKGCNLLIEQGANILYEISQLQDLKRKF